MDLDIGERVSYPVVIVCFTNAVLLHQKAGISPSYGLNVFLGNSLYYISSLFGSRLVSEVNVTGPLSYLFRVRSI